MKIGLCLLMSSPTAALINQNSLLAQFRKNPYFPPPFFNKSENQAQMAIDLLDQILPHVRNHVYPSKLPIIDWKIRVGDIPNGFLPTLGDSSWTVIHPPQAQWGAFDTTFWFRSKVTVPPEFAGNPIVLILDIPDGLLYVNGKPFQGLDKNHRVVFLSEKARTGQEFFLAIQAYSGRKKEQNVFSRAELAVLNPTARSLYTGLLLLKDLEHFYGPTSPESKEIKELIRRTLIYLKYFKPDGEEYPNAIGRALRFMTQAMETELRSETQGLVHLIGQSHIDVVWLWTLRETRRKAGRTFSSMLRLMEEFPDYKYTQSQPILYEFVKKDYPDMYRQIKKRVAEGRWEVLGAMWLEPDCNIPNGESLVRHIQYGKRFFQNEFGADSPILWLPDSFGFNAALPQIMKKSGIQYFFTTKLSWNETTKFPYNSFWWKGIDGSKVLAHMPPIGLEGQMTPKDVKKSWEGFQQNEELSEVLQTYGYGDGGGGPSKEHILTFDYLKYLPTLPAVRIGTAKEFFATLNEKAKVLPTWDSELYLEKHRGTYTTHGWVKKENRECESLLYSAELLSSVAYLNGKRYPATDLEAAWKLLLTNQFHDIVTGTSIADAYDDVRKTYAKIRKTAATLSGNALAGFSRPARKSTKEFHFTLFNPLPWERAEYVEFTVKTKEKRFSVLDGQGRTVQYQLVGKGKGMVSLLCYIEGIPPCSMASISITPTSEKTPASEPWKVSTRVLETPLYRLRMDTQGHLTSIHSRPLRRELLKKGSRGNILQAFHDLPEQWEAWDIEAGYEARKADILKFKSARILEQGPLRLTVEIVHRTDGGSTITQYMQLYHQSPRIDFKNRIKWNDSQILLKAAFPINLRPPEATYEIPFGAIRRSARPRTPEDKAKFEVPAQQWGDLSDAKFGVSLLNDCKYGYDIKDGTLRLTLLRSPRYPHPVEPWRPAPNQVTDQGDHEFTYALHPHQGNWKKGETVRRARELNNPIIVRPNALPKGMPSLFTSLPAALNLDAVKRSDNGQEIIVRLHEAHGESGRHHLDFGYGVDQAFECDLLEQVVTKIKPSKGRLSLKFGAFEIKTLKLKLRPRKRK